MTEGKGFVPNNLNTSADLMQSWHIPRPTLARSSNSSQGSTSGSTNSTQSARSGSLLLTAANLAHIHQSSNEQQTTTTTTTSTRNENIKYYLESTKSNPNAHLNSQQLQLMHNQAQQQQQQAGGDVKKPDPDSVSIASSMHFTVVNMNSRPQVRTRSFCKKHQLSVLVVTMSAIFTIGIITAVFLLEMRAKRMSY